MRAGPLLVVCFALGGCEALFGIHETMGSGGAGGHATTSSMAGGAPAGSSSSSGAGGPGGGAGGPGGNTGASSGGGGSGGAACDSGVTPALFCTGEPQTDFCADFDGDSGTYVTGWSDLNQLTGSKTNPFLDTTIFHSPMGSFRVDGTATNYDGHCNDGESATRLAHTISSNAAGVQIDFWHRRSGNLPTTGNVQNLDLNCDVMSSTYGILNWGMRPGHYGVEVYGTGGALSDKDETLDAPPANQWVHVHMEVTFGTQGKVVVYHDCTNVYEKDTIDTSCATPNTKTLLFGMYTCSEVPAASVWFDDIVVKEL